MSTIPTNYTNEELKDNEDFSYSSDKNNAPTLFQSFRLFIPQYPRNKLSSLTEIPMVMCRVFAIAIENSFLDILELHLTKLTTQRQISNTMKLIKYSKMVKCNILPGKLDLSKLAQSRYIINNPKNYINPLTIDVFHDIPYKNGMILTRNSKYYLRIQNTYFVKLLALWLFHNDELCIRIMENYLLNLSHVIQWGYMDINYCQFVSGRQNISIFVFIELVTAIDYLHERELIHRLLSPQNIFIDYRGHIKLGNLFESINLAYDIDKLLNNYCEQKDNQMCLHCSFHSAYLEPTIQNLLQREHCNIEAYLMMDYMSDYFSLAMIIIELLGYPNVLRCQGQQLLDHSQLVVQIDRYFHSNRICELFKSILQLFTLQRPLRLAHMKMRVQSNTLLSTNSCYWKLRLDKLKIHPLFKCCYYDFDSIILYNSPIFDLINSIDK